MINLGKNKDGNKVYMYYDEIEDAVQNPDKYFKSLNNQQKAKLRKKINRYKRENGMM
jgi:predicted phosphoribosyltransferase